METAETATDHALVRHILATIAYRAAKPLRDVPEGFAGFRAAERARTPVEIVSHMGDLVEWSLTAVQGRSVWRATEPLPWDAAVARFFAALAALDAYLASGAEVHATFPRLLQGPLADALTHVGQLSLLRGLAGAPVRGENYVRAAVEIGRVTADQAPPVLEF